MWSNGNLPDDGYDEFVLHLHLPGDLKPGSMLHFPVVQECADGAAERRIESPKAGKSAADHKRPAPDLKVLPNR